MLFALCLGIAIFWYFWQQKTKTNATQIDVAYKENNFSSRVTPAVNMGTPPVEMQALPEQPPIEMDANSAARRHQPGVCREGEPVGSCGNVHLSIP